MRRSTLLTAVMALYIAAKPFCFAAELLLHSGIGTTFQAPDAWTVKTLPRQIVLSAPEGNLQMAIVDVGSATDAVHAVRSAWAAFRNDEHHTLKVSTPQAAEEGWDEEEGFEYETSPNEHLVVGASAYRAGKTWTVFLVDGNEATAEKRLAAWNLVLASLRPAGYHRESFAGRTPHAFDPTRIAALSRFIADGMTKLRIPGAAFAVMEHGRLVYEGGIGVRELSRAAPVDAHTRFLIASNTKGMTTLLLAKLIDQGKLSWNLPVMQVYPAFRLGNADTTRSALVRDLVCACTGIPRRDLDWLFDASWDTPPEDTFRQLAETTPTSGFGQVFQYSNLMASAAGYIAGHVAHPDEPLGRAYDSAMQEDVFGPLGMADTTFDFGKALEADHASGHADTIDGKAAVVNVATNEIAVPYRPAGGAWSSVDDVIKYAEDELTEGRLPNGTQLVSARNVLARRIPNVEVGEDETYGMGLDIDRHDGVTVIHHGGSLYGFKTDWLVVTEADVAAVILTNADNGAELLEPFRRRVLELLYDGKPDAQKQLEAAASQIDREEAKERPHLVLPADGSAAALLAGSYVNVSLGRIRVIRNGAHVVFDFGTWKSEMASRKNEDGSVSFVTTAPSLGGLAFVTSQVGDKQTLVIHDHQHAYTYTSD